MVEEKLERVFLEFSARKLEQFTRRIGDCLGRLSSEQIWFRGSGNENAAGNLVLHLCGNVRHGSAPAWRASRMSASGMRNSGRAAVSRRRI